MYIKKQKILTKVHQCRPIPPASHHGKKNKRNHQPLTNWRPQGLPTNGWHHSGGLQKTTPTQWQNSWGHHDEDTRHGRCYGRATEDHWKRSRKEDPSETNRGEWAQTTMQKPEATRSSQLQPTRNPREEGRWRNISFLISSLIWKRTQVWSLYLRHWSINTSMERPEVSHYSARSSAQTLGIIHTWLIGCTWAHQYQHTTPGNVRKPKA